MGGRAGEPVGGRMGEWVWEGGLKTSCRARLGLEINSFYGLLYVGKVRCMMNGVLICVRGKRAVDKAILAPAWLG